MNTSTPKQPSRRRLKVIREFWPYARPYRGRIALALLILFLDTLVSLAEPWPVKLIFDNVLLGKHLHSPWSLLIPESVAQDPVLLLVILCGALLLLAVVSAGATYFSTRLLALAGQRIIFRLRCALFAHLQQLSPAFYDRQRLGDLLTRLTSDVLAIQDMLVVALPMLLLSGMTIVGMIVILVLINPIFGVLGVVIAFALYLVLRKYLGNIKRVARQTRHQEGDANAVAQENLLGIRVVQAFGMEKHARQRYEESITEALQLGEVAADLESSMPSMVSLVTTANVEASLMMSDAGIMNLYAGLVKSDELRELFLGTILREFQLTEASINELFGGTPAERRPRLALAIHLRERALKPLHREQVRLLADWRTDSSEDLLRALLLTVNAIAMGQKMTG